MPGVYESLARIYTYTATMLLRSEGEILYARSMQPVIDAFYGCAQTQGNLRA